ncbi:MAG: histidine kinase [Cellulomonas sp.]|nr:histidine kinase [Cellulomonas sp.]
MTEDRRPSGPIDAATAVAFGVAWCLAVTGALASGLWQPAFVATWWWAGAFAVVALALRRMAPSAGLLVVAVAYPLGYRVGLQSDIHVVPILIAVFVVVRAGRLPWWGAAAIGAGAVLALMTAGGFEPGGGWRLHPTQLQLTRNYSGLVWLLAAVTTAAYTAHVIRALDRVSTELRAQNAELQVLRIAHARDAVNAERVRIARELHDVVAHHIAAIVVRAQAAEHVASIDPREATDAVPWIAATGREALTATRAIVEVLEQDGPPPPRPLRPAGGRDTLQQTVDRVRGAGVDVEAELPEVWPAMAPDTELAVLRIAQEALTNVLVHSQARRASLAMHDEADHVVLIVTDPGPAAPDPAQATRIGRGLVNMRERARGAHGDLTAGPDGAGWVVRLRVPCRPTAPALGPA